MGFKNFYQQEENQLDENIFSPLWGRGSKQEKWDAQWSSKLAEVTKKHAGVKQQLEIIKGNIKKMVTDGSSRDQVEREIKKAWKIIYGYFSLFGLTRGKDGFEVKRGFWRGPSKWEWQAIKGASSLSGQDLTGQKVEHTLDAHADRFQDTANQIYDLMTIDYRSSDGSDATAPGGVGIMSGDYVDPVNRISEAIADFDSIGKILNDSAQKVSTLAGVNILAPNWLERLMGKNKQKQQQAQAQQQKQRGVVGKAFQATKGMGKQAVSGGIQGFEGSADKSTAAAAFKTGRQWLDRFRKAGNRK
jgi:hypothetical protein